MSAMAQVRATMASARDGLLAFVSSVAEEAGLALPVVGSPTDLQGGLGLVILPYQTVLETQPGTPTLPLAPHGADVDRGTIPEPWRSTGRAMTQVLANVYPKREQRGPGLGPLDPLPLLDSLPAPLVGWYRAHADDWIVDRHGKEAGRLPFVSWRQPFALAVRFAALVLGEAPAGSAPDRVRLEALGVVAAAIRLRRFFEISAPAASVEPALLELVEVFSRLEVEGSAELQDLLPGLLEPRPTVLGLTPHHELGDADLALLARTLGTPMQPAMVFSVRLALGAGPELAAGALPHLGTISKAEGP